MDSDEIVDFCGGQHLWGFGGYSAKVAKPWLLDQIEEYKNCRCMLMAVLNSDQQDRLGKTFKALGFRAASSAINPNSANKCTLYVYKYKHSRKKVIQDITNFDY